MAVTETPTTVPRTTKRRAPRRAMARFLPALAFARGSAPEMGPQHGDRGPGPPRRHAPRTRGRASRNRAALALGPIVALALGSCEDDPEPAPWWYVASHEQDSYVVIVESARTDYAADLTAIIDALCEPESACFVEFRLERPPLHSGSSSLAEEARARIAEYSYDPAINVEHLMLGCHVASDSKDCVAF